MSRRKEPEKMDFFELVREINDIENIADRIYDVREREGKGWEGPKTMRYGELVTELEARLKGKE